MLTSIRMIPWLYRLLPMLLMTPLFLTAQESENLQRLREHSDEFRKDIIEVTDGVYLAIGYALANVIMIEGDDGLIIVDTTESVAAAT